MTANPLAYVDVADLDRRRRDDVDGIRALDRRSLADGTEFGIAVLGILGGALAMFGFSSVLVGAVFAVTAPTLSELWQVDEAEQGARLRRVLPVRRRSVVTARYLGFVARVAGFLVSCVTTMVAIQITTGRDPGDAWFSLWMASLALVAGFAAGMPVRIRYGLGPTYVVVLGCGLALLLPGALLARHALGGEFFPTVGAAVVAVAVVVMAALVFGLLSHRIAVRLYDRKDL